MRLLAEIDKAEDFPADNAPDLVEAVEEATKFIVSMPTVEGAKPKPLAVYIPPVVKSASTKKVKRQVLHIFNREIIPRAYLIEDEVLIRKTLLDGNKVPGCEMVEETAVEGK